MNIIRDDIDFSAYVHETEAQQRVRPAREYVQELIERLGRPVVREGHPLPWRKVGDRFRFRPGEVTLWAGVNGHGKSLMTGMIALDLIAARERVCIASFEMKPHSTLTRMLRQWTGFASDDQFAQDPDNVAALRDLYEQFQVIADRHLWFYDQQGTVTVDQIIGVARYCAKELGIRHIFIDSLMKCVRGEDDYNGQKALVDELTAIARDYRCHIHLVHHIRKLENELRRPDKQDVKGSGAITDQVDNVLLVWRNKADAKKPEDGDALLICCKQRHGEWEGGIKLYFEPQSQQYVGDHGDPATNFWERAK